MSSQRASSRNLSPDFVLWQALFFSVIWLCSRMYWHGTAAAATAAAAAFRGGQVLPAPRRHRFPDARLKIHLRFNTVRILWALLVMFHDWLWRFATQIIQVFFFFAQWWTVIQNSRHYENSKKKHFQIFNDGKCTGVWIWNHSRNFSLVTTVNRFVNDSPNFNFLPSFLLHRSSLPGMYSNLCPHLRLLLRTFSGMYSYFWTWRMSINAAKWTFLTFVFVCLLHDLLWFLVHCRLCISNQYCLKWKIFCFCFSVSRGMRLWETDLQSLLNHSRSSLNRTTFVLTWEYLVLPGFWGLLEEFCLTDTLCRETRQHVLAFNFRKSLVKSFLEIFS